MSSKRGLRGVPSGSHSTGSLIERSLAGRHVALGHVGSLAEEVVLHLAGQVLASARIRQVEAVFVDQHGLLLEPLGPGFLAHALIDALAEFTGIRGEIEAFGFFAELDALDGTGHEDASRMVW